MIATFQIILPLFALIGIGYAIGRGGVLSSDQVRGLGRFVILIALPAVVFQALATRRIGEIVRLDYLAVYASGSLIAFAAGFAWFRADRRCTTAVAGSRAMGMSSSNSGFIGLPIALQLFGASGAIPIALNMLVENLIILPLTLVLIQNGAATASDEVTSMRTICASLIRTPLLIAILCGCAFSLLTIPLPGLVARPLAMLAGASAPVALICIGAGLSGVQLKGQRAPIAAIASGKLLLHPALIMGLLTIIPIADPMLRRACILSAAVPMITIFPILARQAGDEQVSAAALVVTTLLSFVTIAAVLALTGSL